MLDISRLISRAGRTPTGIDRVELAYLQHFLKYPDPFLAVVRTTLGYVLLGRDGASEIAARLAGERPWGSVDRWSRLAQRKPQTVRQAESDLRRFALDRTRPRRLPEMLKRHLARGTAYLNVGHSNLTERMLWAVKHAFDGRVSVMIHDTIPLDHPEWQRPGMPDRFRAMLRRVQAQANLVIYNSEQTLIQAEAYMSAWGPAPRCVVAPLGVTLPDPDPAAIPTGVEPDRPFFVTVGTIEPRKGHGLLLDIWADMDDPPGLLICGARGWNNDPVFEQLDRLSPDDQVRELSGLSDGAIVALLQRSRGLLFPSRAEGYGLPPIEAAALGVPVVVNDLAVYRETMGQVPIYAGESDRYQWIKAIRNLLNGPKWLGPRELKSEFVPPDWEAHFNRVLRFT